MFLRKPPAETNPLDSLSRKELLGLCKNLQGQVMNMHAELTGQHARANEAVQIVSDMYSFMFNLLHQYVATAQVYREQHDGKVIPALWIAARLCEQFELLFNTRPLEHFGLGPSRVMLKNVFEVSRRPIAKGSRIETYLAVTQEAGNVEEEQESNESPQTH